MFLNTVASHSPNVRWAAQACVTKLCADLVEACHVSGLAIEDDSANNFFPTIVRLIAKIGSRDEVISGRCASSSEESIRSLQSGDTSRLAQLGLSECHHCCGPELRIDCAGYHKRVRPETGAAGVLYRFDFVAS